ncbi:diguanylate cyclase domain-containing protein [Marinicella sediminis]|uniref:diguanylate cyclase n=1 Tax=Marinicella sediminis TaxID=1792834 RepID=A0ABV7JF42_9GAMM|nr:GGDEF domain-containing protein [Marinicella sediminis]
MTLIRRLLLPLILLLTSCWAAPASGQAFAEEFEAWNLRISSEPQKVLDELINHPLSTTDLTYQAQYHFLLSSVYLNLVYPGKALEAADQGLARLSAQEPGWLYHRLLLVKSQAMELSGQAAEARPMAAQALSWAENNQDAGLLIDALIGLGYVENTLRQYTSALNHFMRAYELAPQYDAVITQSAIAGSIALVYEYRKEYALAIPFFEEAVAHHRSTSNLLELSIALYGLGRANKHLGNDSTGISQLEESLHISRAIDDDQGVAYALKELAPVYQLTDKQDQARSMLNEAADLFTRSQNRYMLFDVHKSLAQLNLNMNDVRLAKDALLSARVHLDEQRMPIQAIALAELEAQLLAKEGLYRQAFEQLIKTVSRKQQLLAEQSTRELHELRTRHELQSKEQENLKLAEQNATQKLEILSQQQRNQTLSISVGAAVVILILLSILIYLTKKQQQALTQLANIDQLTGLPNRNHILKLAADCQQQLEAQQRLTLCMLDLDHFKSINDQLGHDVGDQVLSQVGAICKTHITSPHQAGRFGGEEFLLVFVDLPASEVEQILKALQQSVKQAGQTILPTNHQLTFSAGISHCHPGDDIKNCIISADLTMYQAKQAGRDRVCQAKPDPTN